MRFAIKAPRVSLSPNLISSVMTVSFSLMIGTTPEREQRGKRRAGVEIALAIGEVVVGKQDLRRLQAVFGEHPLIDLDQAHLADCGRGLQLMDFLRSACPAQALHPGGNRAGRHQRNRPAMLPSRAIWRAHSLIASLSSPVPLLVTRALPTFTTMRRASRIRGLIVLRGG